MTGIGEALVDLLIHAVHRGRPRLRRVTEWITDAARPPVGVRLVSDDGSEYSGFVVVDRNEPKLMLALRVGVTRSPAPASREQAFVVPERRDLWRYEDDQFR